MFNHSISKINIWLLQNSYAYTLCIHYKKFRKYKAKFWSLSLVPMLTPPNLERNALTTICESNLSPADNHTHIFSHRAPSWKFITVKFQSPWPLLATGRVGVRGVPSTQGPQTISHRVDYCVSSRTTNKRVIRPRSVCRYTYGSETKRTPMCVCTYAMITPANNGKKGDSRAAPEQKYEWVIAVTEAWIFIIAAALTAFMDVANCTGFLSVRMWLVVTF